MQNAMMDLMKQFNDNAMNTAKRVGELNMKTFETLTTKQSELLSFCFETGNKNVEALAKAKDPQEVVTLQQAAMTACSEKWMANVRETTELLTATRDEMVAIAEEATQYMTESTEKATALNKQAMTDNMDKATAAVEKAVAQATNMTEEAVAATKEAGEKTVVAAKKINAEVKQAA